MKRHGYTDYAIPLKKLRDALAKAMRGECARMSREDLVRHGVTKILDAGLFEQYADEFKAYIVMNALNMAEGDVRAAGVDPVRGTGIPPASKPRPKPLTAEQVAAERTHCEAEAKKKLSDLAPVLFMRLPTPFTHADGTYKTLGELTGKEGRKLNDGLAKFFKGVPDGKRLIDVKSEGALRELWRTL